MVAYAAETNPQSPTHGGTASMPTLGQCNQIYQIDLDLLN